MKAKQFLIEVLKGLEVVVVPSPKGHHAITFARFGSDGVGWEDKLALQVNDGGIFRCFFLDEEDLERTPEQIISEIVKLLKQPMSNEQLGVSGVQYVKDGESSI